MRTFLLIVALLIRAATLVAQQTYTGEISGTVLDSRTLEPLPQVHVMVMERPGTGAATTSEGKFRISGLGVGTYSLRISAVGYTSQVLTNVVVTTGRILPMLIKLDQTTIEVEEVTAEALYFGRAQQLSPVSANVVNRSEVLRMPGGVQDVQRVLQNFPGVASSTDNMNELIVRGGAAYENLTLLDHMEIPSINHYSNQFNSAGPINMVNADMIEDVQFSAGGFSAQYGDKTSSVMNLTVREGNRSRAFASKTAMNMAGIGTLVEGGIAEGRGSYIFSIRNSLLEVVDKIMGLSTISLTAVPKYWDMQTKIVYDLSPSHTLIVNGLYGDSRINLSGDPQEEDALRKNILDSSSVQNLYPRIRQLTAGLSLRSLYGKIGYSMVTLYTSGSTTNIDIHEDFAVRSRGPAGEVLSHKVISTRRVFSNNGSEAFVGGKFELFLKPHPRHDLAAGMQILTSRGWENEVYIAPDTARYDLDRNGTFETGPVIMPEGVFYQHVGFGDASKYYLFVSDKISLLPRLHLTLGLRYDNFTYSGSGALSPRLALGYALVPGTAMLTFATGRYAQVQPFPFFFDRRGIGYNRSLSDMRANHYVLGLDLVLGRGLKMSLEAYAKQYDRVAVSEDFIYSVVDTFWSDRYLTTGERQSYGVEFFLEQKQVEDLFGTVSLSLSRTRERDPRIPPLVDRYASDYDYPVILTLIGGKVVKGVRSWLNDAPFYLKYPSYLLPISDEMEISLRYRYQTGRSYTPKEYVRWKQIREGGVTWSHGAWRDSQDHNGARYADYARLDLQWLSRFYFSTWNINVYVALMNVLDRKNVFYQNYRTDGTVETVYQFAFFPVVGIEAEF
ncbi:MAG: TonB-dependent receptor plug [Bacteroidetes bacterium]|nr:TonB-dependent receptor plug [Bacteroidota bacterium]